MKLPYFSFFLCQSISFFQSQNKACVYQWEYSVFHHNMNMINCWKSKAYCCNKKKIQKTSRKNWITISFIYIMYFITTYYFCICQKKKIIQELKHFVPISVEYIESTLPHLASFKLKKDDAIQTACLSDWFLYNREEGLLNVKVTLKPCFHLML